MNQLLRDGPAALVRSARTEASILNLDLPTDLAMTLVLLPTTLILCRSWSIRPNWKLTEFAWSAVAIVVTAMMLAAIYGRLRWLVARLMVSTQRPNSKQYSGREFVSIIASTLALLVACSWIYSHVKVGVLMGGSRDDLLRKLDQAICFGHDGWTVARSIVPVAAASQLHVIYMLFLPVVVSGIVWLSLRRQYDQARKLRKAVIVGYYLGVFAYFTIPSYGPAFAYSSADCQTISMAAARVQSLLLDATVEVHAKSQSATVHAWRYIAAFPSLHFSHVLILCWFLRRNKVELGLAVCFSALTAISTIYFGWHYIVDLLGGVLIAVAAILVVERVPRISFRRPTALPNL